MIARNGLKVIYAKGRNGSEAEIITPGRQMAAFRSKAELK
jgi:hypothetical protein